MSTSKNNVVSIDDKKINPIIEALTESAKSQKNQKIKSTELKDRLDLCLTMGLNTLETDRIRVVLTENGFVSATKCDDYTPVMTQIKWFLNHTNENGLYAKLFNRSKELQSLLNLDDEQFELRCSQVDKTTLANGNHAYFMVDINGEHRDGTYNGGKKGTFRETNKK